MNLKTPPNGFELIAKTMKHLGCSNCSKEDDAITVLEIMFNQKMAHKSMRDENDLWKDALKAVKKYKTFSDYRYYKGAG